MEKLPFEMDLWGQDLILKLSGIVVSKRLPGRLPGEGTDYTGGVVAARESRARGRNRDQSH